MAGKPRSPNWGGARAGAGPKRRIIKLRVGQVIAVRLVTDDGAEQLRECEVMAVTSSAITLRLIV